MAHIYKCKFVAGKQWYPFLVHQEGRSKEITLFSSVPYSTENIYVRATFDGYYSFATFSDARELKKYIEIFHPAYRCFDEIVVSNAQKPRFDVDIKDTEVIGDMDIVLQETLNHLLDGITDMIKDITLEDNIRIYTSHGPNKRSMHLIVDGYFHDSHDNAKGFYQRALEYIPLALRQYVDHGIYGQNKQLRIEGCTKWRDIRTKTLREKYTYRGREIEIRWPEVVDKFSSSLITQVANCTLLPPYAIEKKVVANNDAISDILVNAAMQLGTKKLGSEFPFDYIKSMGPIILLKRISSSLCPTCNVIHEKEHPYLRVSGLDVFFNCRRSVKYLGVNKSTHLGRVDELDSGEIGDSVEVKGGKEPIPSKGRFTIRSRDDEVSDEELPEAAKADIPKAAKPRDTPKAAKVEVHIPKMNTNEIMNRFSNLNRSSKVRRTRKAKVESDSLSTMIDYSSIF